MQTTLLRLRLRRVRPCRNSGVGVRLEVVDRSRSSCRFSPSASVMKAQTLRLDASLTKLESEDDQRARAVMDNRRSGE